MFSVDLISVVCFLVDKFLDRKGKIVFNEDGTYTRPGLYIKFPVKVLKVLSTGTDNRFSHRDIVMVFAGNTSVWYSVYGSMSESRGWKSFTNSSNHDSCWRNDGFRFLNDLYFEMCREVDPKVAPIKLYSEQSFLLWTDILFCQVTYSPRDDEFRCGLVDVKFDGELL